MAKEIPLTNGMVALVDDSDYQSLCQYTWYAQKGRKTCYARRIERGKTIYMHQQIMGDNVQCIDHTNQDGLDNQRVNLRYATPEQQGANRGLFRNNQAGYKGVSWYPLKNKYRAQINIEKRPCHIGWYSTAIDAAKAYDAMAAELYGEFASLNFPL